MTYSSVFYVNDLDQKKLDVYQTKLFKKIRVPVATSPDGFTLHTGSFPPLLGANLKLICNESYPDEDSLPFVPAKIRLTELASVIVPVNNSNDS